MNYPINMSSFTINNIDKVKDTKSIFIISIKNKIWNKEFTFRYRSNMKNIDLENISDVHLLGIYANDFYVDKYLLPS